VENVVTHFESEELRLTMGPIGAAGWSTNGTFGTDDQSVRQRFRQLVLRGLRSSDPEVRTHAFEALLPAYGVDFLVADGQGGFRANPESVEALDALAANETDASLRARAQSGLLTLDERVRKAIRKRNKRAESATPNGD
jgi:pyruvate-formate lyase